MPRLTLKGVQLMFEAVYAPKAFGEGDPAYSGKFPIPKNHSQVAAIEAAMLTAAKEKWNEKGEIILKGLIEDGEVCFQRREYKNKKTGEPSAGFEGTFYLSARNGGENPTKPTAFAPDNTPAGADSGLIYSGRYVDASVDIYAQDNKYGRRINCSLRGVRAAFGPDGQPGESFGGGQPAQADEFGEPMTGETADFV